MADGEPPGTPAAPVAEAETPGPAGLAVGENEGTTGMPEAETGSAGETGTARRNRRVRRTS